MLAEVGFVGTSSSTFAVWVAYLGNATVATLYGVKSPEKREWVSDEGWHVQFNFTNKFLAHNMMFPFFHSECQDEVEATLSQDSFIL